MQVETDRFIYISNGTMIINARISKVTYDKEEGKICIHIANDLGDSAVFCKKVEKEYTMLDIYKILSELDLDHVINEEDEYHNALTIRSFLGIGLG